MRTIEQELSRIDLNLLVSLSVLLKERNVTRAASALYTSQPAMSRNLAKLREIFHDPLFYRESSGLVATQKALELEEQINNILINVKSTIESSSFNPNDCSQTFSISAPPLLSEFICGNLSISLCEIAPYASLVEFPATKNPTQQLVERTVDFTIHVERPLNQTDFICTKLGNIFSTFYVYEQHPLAKKDFVSLEDCLKYRFVDVMLDIRSISSINNPIDTYLESQGISRDIAFKSGQLNTLIKVMEKTTTILASSNLLMGVSNNLIPIYFAKDIPDLNFNLYLIEHKRTTNSSSHQWFKTLILENSKKIFN
ncbi:LysR family transcriptional regulator [Vibrio rotiferianus]|uniref:LysR family transcriptional regulator n=1 Tax=Vibrio rotiferianus TaxID=190895 RepID=UPI00406A4336